MNETTLDLAITALDSNDAAGAERLCRERLASNPNDVPALTLLATCLWRQGHRDDAVSQFAVLAAQHPGVGEHLRNHATALWQSGNLAAAEEAFTAAVQLTPDSAELLEQLGLVQLESGQPIPARESLLRAFGQDPDSPSIRIHAGRACAACRDSRAGHLLAPWRSWVSLDDGLLFDLADLLPLVGEADGAVDVLETLLARSPSHLAARILLASVYERVNRLADAEALLQDIALSEGTDNVRVRVELAHQRAELAMRKREHGKARELLEQAGPRSDKDVGHWFALARACDKLNDAPAAMQALAAGHAAQINGIRLVAPRHFEPGTDPLPNSSDRVSESDFREWRKVKSPDAANSPVFVVGFPRSGTTLLEQMLDAHPRLQSMDERPFFNNLSTLLENSTGLDIPRDLGKLDQRDCDELRKGYLTMACAEIPRRWDARLVDKNPLNMLWLPMIYRLFPAAKFILALRHPCDVILSCYMQNFTAASLAVAGQSLESLARAYVATMEHWLHHVAVFQPDVFVSRYEDLVADTPQQTRRIAGFLGLDDADTMLQFADRAREKGYIKTPSYTQVIESINSKAVGRWQRYGDYFQTALPILDPMLRHWGYDTAQ